MERQNPEIESLFDDDDDISPGNKFEFISLRLFSDEEFLQEDKRKYRNVFQGPEIDYIYGEFSFYNLLYNKEDWVITIHYRIYSPEKENEIADFEFKRTVPKDCRIFKAVRGYGNNIKGKFWKKGLYSWQAYVDGDTELASEIFYIEDKGKAGNKGMPYMILEEIKLLDNGSKDKYACKCFDKNNTEAVDIELTGRNLLKEECWWAGEFIFLFKTELGEQKAELRKAITVKLNDKTINFKAIHKSKIGFSDGIYFVEAIFMENLIARIPFRVGNEEIRTTIEEQRIFFPDVKEYFNPAKEDTDILSELNELTGLDEVKQTVKNQLTYFKYQMIKQKRRGKETGKINLHSLFTGNPGTGKTAVAKFLGKIYRDTGLLSSGHVYEVGRPELIAEYIGQTALKTKEAIEKARGGILFIDEAYSLAREKDNKRDFGAEAIEVLIKEMSDGPGDIAIIAAGYSEEINIFIESNPGLRSRFKYKFHFRDYTPDELLEIAEYHCKKKKLILSGNAYEQLEKLILKHWRNRDRTFGNARFVNELIEKAEMNLAVRIMKHKNVERIPFYLINTLEAKDFACNINNISNQKISLPVDEEELPEALKELNRLRGLGNVKDNIRRLTKLIRYYKEENINYLSEISLHSVFTGNPGTGKTTVARIMAKIFRALGILERGHLVECSRDMLVSGYTGQTAIKTAEMIDKATGGVLFIDEAYSLARVNEGDFGKEAIDTLIKKMEDRRGEFIVICAGYDEQMKYFLDSNPGLRARFDRVIEFPDYNEKELTDIGYDLLKSHGIKRFDKDVSAEFENMIKLMCRNKQENFANAREVRKLVEQAVMNQNIRIADIPYDDRTDDLKEELLPEDLENVQTVTQNRKLILGFSGADLN